MVARGRCVDSRWTWVPGRWTTSNPVSRTFPVRPKSNSSSVTDPDPSTRTSSAITVVHTPDPVDPSDTQVNIKKCLFFFFFWFSKSFFLEFTLNGIFYKHVRLKVKTFNSISYDFRQNIVLFRLSIGEDVSRVEYILIFIRNVLIVYLIVCRLYKIEFIYCNYMENIDCRCTFVSNKLSPQAERGIIVVRFSWLFEIK